MTTSPYIVFIPGSIPPLDWRRRVLSEVTREGCLAWLAGAGLSPEEIKALFALDADPVQLHDSWMRSETFRRDAELPEKLCRALTKSGTQDLIDRYSRLIAQMSIQAITILDPDYPPRLRLLPNAPSILFCQGSLTALDGPSVSVVGSRNASLKGLEATRAIAEQLSRAGVRVISGLAYGIDAAAHQGCLRGPSPTIAVLGCGLDQNYPAENAALRRQILEKSGLVLSEYAPGEKPLGWHFPFRNRIVTGLGDCLVVMEAQIRSGSMTSVQHALDQGREVFVYPGDPDSRKSEGNHQLLRDGANYFTTAQDLLEDMGWLDKAAPLMQNTSRAQETEASLSAGEKSLCQQLSRGEQSFDELCAALRCTAAELNANLSMLQIRGYVRALPGKRYQLLGEE